AIERLSLAVPPWTTSNSNAPGDTSITGVSTSSTTSDTGTTTSGRAGSLLCRHRFASSTSPVARPVESNVTCTDWLPPGATEPATGDTDTHDVPPGTSHDGPSCSAVPVTLITICIPGNPIAATSVGSVKLHDADRRYDGAV